MNQESKYLTDKSVFRPVVCSLLVSVAGAVIWAVVPEISLQVFLVGLLFVIMGLAGLVNNILSCCWYPVVLDKHIILKHFFFPGLSRIIGYEDVMYMRVAEFLVRRYDHSTVLTVRMKDGKRQGFILMTKPEQAGQLSREILGKGVPDTMPVSVADRKVFLSFKGVAAFVLFLIAIVALYVWVVFELTSPLIIVVTLLFAPLIIAVLCTLSYVVIEDRRVMLKYLVFRNRNLDLNIDAVDGMSFSSDGHFEVSLKTPDSRGKSSYTRMVSLVSINMIQEINACLKFLGVHLF